LNISAIAFHCRWLRAGASIAWALKNEAQANACASAMDNLLAIFAKNLCKPCG